MSGASAVIHRQNKFIAIFNRLGAVDEEHSITLEEAGIRGSYIFNRMVNRGVFIEFEKGKFYIDNEAVIRFKKGRRDRAFLALAVILVIAAVCYYLGIGQ